MPTTPLRDLRRFHHEQFDATHLVEAKAGRTLSVCLPARNEATTVGDIVATIRRELLDKVPLVDEVLVVDDHSTDDTAAVARDAGARVVDAASVLPHAGTGHGKGEVLWKSVHASCGDLIVWCDADLREFGPRFVVGIAGPLITNPQIAFAKGFYARPENDGRGGGRVTELVARPLLSLLMPHLAGVGQPLAGEYGGRRDVLEQLPFVEGYGVDIGLLIDVVALVGAEAVVEVDLDVRVHRNRPLHELSPQAMAVAQTILRRARPDLVDATAELVLPGRDPMVVDVSERPPLVQLPDYLARSA